MTLCDLVYAILRRGGSNLQSRFLNPDAVLNDSVAAQSPRGERTGTSALPRAPGHSQNYF